MRHHSGRKGVTLIEIIAAIAIAGFVIASGAALLDQLNDQGSRIAKDGVASARIGNGHRLLRRLLANAEPTFDTTRRFRGDSTTITYFTQCPTVFGWIERCEARLAFDHRSDSTDLVALFTGGGEITLNTQRDHAEFRFLDLARRDSGWTAQWTASASLPNAIAIVTKSDTVIVPVGAAR